MSKEAMQMALDVLINKKYAPSIGETTEALEAALAQPEPLFTQAQVLEVAQKLADSALLNSSPPQRKPISSEQIDREFYGLIDFVRRIEAIHGIRD